MNIIAEHTVLHAVYGLSKRPRYNGIVPITAVKASSKIRGQTLRNVLITLERDNMVDLMVAQDRFHAEHSSIGGWYDPVRGWIGYVGYRGSTPPPSYTDRAKWRASLPAHRRQARSKHRR